MSGTVVHSESEDSNDSDYELIKFLKSQKDTKGSVAKFKVTRKRLKSKAQASNPDLFGDGGREALCHVCKMIRLSSLQGRGHKLPGSFESLHRSAATCAVCNLILTSLRRKHTGLDDKLTESSVMQLEVTYGNEGVSDYKTTRRPSPRVHLNEAFHLTMSREPEGVIYIKALIKSRFGDKHYLDIQSTTRIFTNRDDISQRYNIPMDLRPKGDEKFGLMEKWLKEDPTPLVSPYSYDSNIGSGASAVCPSRLIYLGCSPDLRGRKLKLVTLQEASSLSTKEEVRSPRYVTLSHRWGSSHHFITTQANLNSRYQGFTFEDLPQTYQDAAVVCARLGYQFLWIDAVCIVQDDPIEWLKESEMMGDIYRFGSFTIATHCSEDDSQGFLRDAFRKRGSAKLDQTKYPSTFMRATADLELDVTKSPLSKRGWVLQERFLSTRIIHFTIGMIYWETSRCTKSEDGLLESASQGINTNINGEIPGPSDKIVSLPLSLRTLQQFHLQASVRFSNFSKLLETSDFDELNSATTSETASLRSPVEWYHLVEMYSTCSLTQAKDRLIAISGIAKFLQRQREIPYLAGIWQDSLAIGLWWLHVGSHSPDPPVQRASSWSWASREGPIQFPLADERLKFRVNCEFLAVDNANPSWLNGQGGLRIRTQVFNLTDRVILDGAYTSIFQESLPLWESGIEGLWTEDDPSLRLFNVSNARSLQLSRGIDQVSSSSTEYKSKSWCVLDSPSYHGFTRRYTTGLNGDAFLIASIAVFHRKSPAPSADREARPDEDIHLVLVLTASSQSYRWDGSYRRIGVGVIGSRFLDTLTRSSRMLHGSLLPPIPYVKRVITIV